MDLLISGNCKLFLSFTYVCFLPVLFLDLLANFLIILFWSVKQIAHLSDSFDKLFVVFRDVLSELLESAMEFSLKFLSQLICNNNAVATPVNFFQRVHIFLQFFAINKVDGKIWLFWNFETFVQSYSLFGHIRNLRCCKPFKSSTNRTIFMCHCR